MRGTCKGASGLFPANYATKLQQEAGVYVGGRGSGGPMESRGHAVDLSVAKKYPKLFKNSNANKPSSIVYQDPLVNERIFLSISDDEYAYSNLGLIHSNFIISSLSNYEALREISVKKFYHLDF